MKRTALAMATLGGWLALPSAAAAHGQGQGPPATDPLGILLAWHVDIPLLLALTITGAAYVSAVRSVDRAHPDHRWPRRRTAAFLLALVAIAVALVSPIDTLSDDLFTVHVLQHMLLVAVAAPLFAVSGIATLALRAATRTTRDRYLLPFLHSRFVGVVSFPVVGWILFAGVMWGSHFSTLYNTALLDDNVHAFEHLLYLGVACLFWWPLLSPDPLRRRIHPGVKLVALLAQMPPMSFLAVVIIGASAPLYGAYLGRTDAFGIDALTDQRIAGSVMWILGDAAILIPWLALLAAFMRHEEAEAKRVDARLDRERAARMTHKETNT